VATWGPGNFDNDAARDHLFEMAHGLAEQIEQALEAATLQKLSGQGSVEQGEMLEPILPNVEIICVLHETIGGGFLPEPESVDDWESRFEHLSDVASAERCDVIRATFERLRQLAQQCWEE
jgi:hypothetical protein